MRPIESEIFKILTESFKPSVLEIENESDMHSGPPGRESHFKVYIVSEAFTDKKRIERQRMVFDSMGDLMGKIHAFALRTSTSAEHEKSQVAFESPLCASKTNK